jgi:hypothetical protein
MADLTANFSSSFSWTSGKKGDFFLETKKYVILHIIVQSKRGEDFRTEMEGVHQANPHDIYFLERYLTMNHLQTSVADPDPNPDQDPPDPRVYGPPGSGSGTTSQRYGSGSCSGSGSGSFYHHAKIVTQTLIPSVLWLFLNFYLWKMM